MLSEFSYPVICTHRFVETVNFYEDYLNYIPEMEMVNYVILKRSDWDNCYLAIMDASHPGIPELYRKPVSGMLLTYPVKNVEQVYDDFYWEGLNIISGLKTTPCLTRCFHIEDPNGILISVGENANAHYSKEDLERVGEHSFTNAAA